VGCTAYQDPSSLHCCLEHRPVYARVVDWAITNASCAVHMHMCAWTQLGQVVLGSCIFIERLPEVLLAHTERYSYSSFKRACVLHGRMRGIWGE
jgi:hypothetical protein